MVNNGWYFIAAVIDVKNKTSQYILCNRADGAVWKGPVRTYTGELNPSCTADIVIGMHADSYFYAGGFDDWFIETNSALTIDALERHFKSSILANGGDNAASVDAVTTAGTVTLRKNADGTYPLTGQLTTIASPCHLSGTGRVSVTSEYTAGVTALSLIETATSDNLSDWSAWQAVGSNGELSSPNRNHIRYRITFTTNDNTTAGHYFTRHPESAI